MSEPTLHLVSQEEMEKLISRLANPDGIPNLLNYLRECGVRFTDDGGGLRTEVIEQ